MSAAAFTASQLPLFHVVGFSGHRQVSDPAAASAAIRSALESLRRELPGEWVALSSLAVGGDQLFFQTAIDLGWSWHAILPLPPAEFARDFSATEWPAVQQKIARAEHTRIITENGSREDAYLDCGLETVNSSDVLVVLWDGQPARGKGGTADVVAYAQSLGKPVIIIDAATYAVRSENFDNLKREDRHLAGLNQLPEAHGGWGENPFNAPANIFAFQQKCDVAASRGAPFFRRLIVGTVVLHVTATLIAAASLAFGLHLGVLPWMKLFCLVAAVVLALLVHRYQHSMQNWVSCRLAAEFCRSALATWGLPRATTLFDDLHLPNARGLTRALQILHIRAAATHTVGLEEFKDRYLKKRIDDQLAYYERQETRAWPLFNRLKFGFWAATLLAVLCTLAYAVSDTAHLDVPHWIAESVFYFLPISLPVVAAAFISLVAINDLQRRVARYRELRAVLNESRHQLAFCQTWNSVERVVLKTERALRQEMLEWHSITSFTESH